MRTVRRSTRFDKDYTRESRGRYRAALIHDLPPILESLVNDLPLPANARDHALSGDRAQYRDCHVKPDLVLIYSKPNPHELLLVRIGTHSELDLS